MDERMMNMTKVITTAEFDEKVTKADLPVLVDFYADWCGPCKMMSPVVDKLAAEFEGKAHVYKVDTDKDGALAAGLGIMSIPTMILFAGGEEKDRVIGAVPEATLRGKLEALI